MFASALFTLVPKAPKPEEVVEEEGGSEGKD
jgi:hypothetical protein